MPKPAYQKITKRFVDGVEIPTSGQTFYNDSELRGFKLRVNATGVKAYVVERRVNGVNRRFVIGKHGALTPELARKEAIRLLGGMAVGDDPVRRKQEQKINATTLTDVLEHYLVNTKLRPNTVATTTGVLNRCVPDWLAKPITSITPNMIIERQKELPHETILGTNGEVEANMCISIINRLMNYAINNFELPDGTPILPVNPVRRFVRNRGWYEEQQRRNVIPDARLADWYKAVMSLENQTYRDFFLFLLLTGLRRGEAQKHFNRFLSAEAKFFINPFEGGSGAPMMEGGFRTRMMQTRIEQLKHHLKYAAMLQFVREQGCPGSTAKYQLSMNIGAWERYKAACAEMGKLVKAIDDGLPDVDKLDALKCA